MFVQGMNALNRCACEVIEENFLSNMSWRYTFSLVYHDSGSQNVRILKHDKHSEITIRATLTLALASPANRGVFNTA